MCAYGSELLYGNLANASNWPLDVVSSRYTDPLKFFITALYWSSMPHVTLKIGTSQYVSRVRMSSSPPQRASEHPSSVRNCVRTKLLKWPSKSVSTTFVDAFMPPPYGLGPGGYCGGWAYVCLFIERNLMLSIFINIYTTKTKLLATIQYLFLVFYLK